MLGAARGGACPRGGRRSRCAAGVSKPRIPPAPLPHLHPVLSPWTRGLSGTVPDPGGRGLSEPRSQPRAPLSLPETPAALLVSLLRFFLPSRAPEADDTCVSVLTCLLSLELTILPVFMELLWARQSSGCWGRRDGFELGSFPRQPPAWWEETQQSDLHSDPDVQQLGQGTDSLEYKGASQTVTELSHGGSHGSLLS